MFKFFISLIIFSSLPAWSGSFDVNDVTVLFDLPARTENLSFLLGVQSSGVKGELLPKFAHSSLLPLVRGSMDYPRDEVEALRVVGVRIDPCFKFANSNACDLQLRLVWQPVELNEEGEFNTYDAGVHTFHRLTAVEFKNLTIKMAALKASTAKLGVSTGGLPLQIHPAFKNTRTRAAFNRELKKIVLEFAGEKNLIRATFMRQLAPLLWWSFGGFEIKNGATISMSIPRQPKSYTDQQFFNEKFQEPMAMNGTFLPPISKDVVKDNMIELLRGYSQSVQLMKPAFETLDKVENPAFFTPETIDCVHCHVASPARAWLSHLEPESYRKGNLTAYRYKGVNLKNTSQNLNNPKSMRTLGYLGRKTAISQRVINESAEVVKVLNARY